MLRELMETIPLDHERDRLVFIGDYIDRGTQSREVVDYILNLKKRHKKVTCLMGNHEEMLLNYLERPDENNRSMFFLNGGRATAKSYGYRGKGGDELINVPRRHRSFFKSLLPIYETEQYIFVHAGLRPRVPLDEQSRKDLLWIRNDFIHSTWDFGKTVIFGHTHFSDPFFADNKIGIDTGAVYGGRLTCLELPSRRIYQV